jgi:hypothetical protein
MAPFVHMFADSRREESLSRGVKMDSRPLFNQHADLAQLVFAQTVFRPVAFAHVITLSPRQWRGGPALLLSNRTHWGKTMIRVLGRNAALRVCPELRQRFVQLVGEFHQLADRRHRAASSL